MTVAADNVAPNISDERLLLNALSIKMKMKENQTLITSKTAKIDTLFMTKPTEKPYP